MQESINRAYCIVYFCEARRSRRLAGIPFKIVILICILAICLAFWFGGSISFFCGTNVRKSHAAQQTLNVRNVLSEVFVDPKITLVRSFLGVTGRSSCTENDYVLVQSCMFFSYEETFIPYSEIFYFAALNKLVYGMTVL